MKSFNSRYHVLLILCLLFSTPSISKKKPPIEPAKASATTFLAIGDWGKKGIPPQRAVADAMAKTSERTQASFIITTGDNFYEDGAASETDTCFTTSFEQVYSAASLQKPWYVCLGNHDYRGNVEAEIAYQNHSKRWHLPARYYSEKFPIGKTGQQMLLVFVDTDPFFVGYYTDPILRDKVLQQDTARQKQWLDSVLSDNTVRWKIVVGHHPCFTGGKQMSSPDTRSVKNALQPILNKNHVDLYICGHAHYLEYMKPEGDTHYFISGSAGEAKPAKLYPVFGKFAAQAYGFMSFTVSKDSVHIDVINDSNKVLYQTSILSRK